MTPRVASLLLGGLLLASVFALAITKIEDTDAWTHLALGRDIVQHRGFPATEQFNFPSLEMPYYNSEWLFGLVFYLAYVVGSATGVILLKAAVVTLAFLILFNDALTPRDPPSHRALGVVIATALLFAILLLVKHRFVERPDIALMVFLSFTIYALNAYVSEGKRYLYLLPALQVLWVNMHPSVVVGTVPFVAVLVGGQLQRLLGRWRRLDLPGTPSPGQLRTVGIVFGAVLLASLLNPYGIDPFVAPFRLAASAWFRHEIIELQPPRLGQDSAPFVLVALVALLFLLTMRRLSLISVLLLAPFVYLGLSAWRFVFLLGIVSAPLLARQLRVLAGHLRERWVRRLTGPAGITVASLLAVLTVLAVAGAGPFAGPSKRPVGFGVSYDLLPEAALRYLDRIGLNGRVFNTFQWGGYIVWRDHPQRIPIVDGRGYLPRGLLDDIKIARASAAHLARLRERYHFDAAIVNYPVLQADLREEMPDVDFSLTSEGWALVYWDDLAMVYLRRTDEVAEIIDRDEYRHVKPANGALYLRRKLSDRDLFPAIEAELRRNVEETGSARGLALLGFVYNEVGASRQAVEVLTRVLHFPYDVNLANAHQWLAIAYGRLGDLERAVEQYRQAARLRDDPLLLYNLGITFARMANDREAIRHLEGALDKDPNLAPAYPPLIAAYRRLGRSERVEELEAAHARALTHARAEEHFRRGVRLYLEGKLHEAAEEFMASIKVNPRNPNPRSNLGYVLFDLGRLDHAVAEQKRALEVDPNFANAHYGLALIYRKRGDHATAREHFEEYLRLDPRGYWARKAQDELTRLPPR
ncbi:MAG: tetratricopeptide repeat protein [Candidatus Methylomirabilia bacterium]